MLSASAVFPCASYAWPSSNAIPTYATGMLIDGLSTQSPRLTIANGLSPERLREQLKVVAEVNEKLCGVRA